MATVTIESVEAIPLSIPFDHWGPPPIFAGRPRTTMDAFLVRVTASNGVVGWGEAFWGAASAVKGALDDRVSPLARGQDVDDAELTPRLERVLHNLGRAGPVIHAISGLDIALWDIRGKLAGVPVHALLGGRRRQRVHAYASLLQYQGSVDLVRRNVARALERGYREIKLHERTPETVAAAREVAGADTPIMVDTNCAWLPEAATAAAMAMAPSKPFWVEEPIWPPEDFAAMAKLRRTTGVPHAPFFGPGYLATLHVLAAKERESALERFFCDLALMPYDKTVPITSGGVDVPDTPGLGADPDPELMRFRV